MGLRASAHRTVGHAAIRLLAVAVFLATVPGAPSAPVAASDVYGPGIMVEEDHAAQRLLLRVRQLAEAGNHDRAAEVVHQVITSEEAAKSLATEDGRLYGPLRDRCHALLLDLPEGVLARYRDLVDAAAGRRFREAAATRDVAGLREVIDLYQCSSYGDDALDRLATTLLDRGDLLGAQEAWGRLLESCPPEGTPDRNVVRLKLAAVASYLGHQASLKTSLQQLRRSGSTDRVRLGGREVVVGKVTIRDLPRPRQARTSERTARSLGKLTRTWHKTFRQVWPLPKWSTRLSSMAGSGRFLRLPASRCAVSGDTVYAKDYNRTVAFDVRSARRLRWQTEVVNLTSAAGRNSANAQDHLPHFIAAYVDVGSQTLSVGEGVVIVTERNLVVPYRRGKRPGVAGNVLAAYEATEGQLLWRRGREAAGPLGGALFIAPATIHGDEAYVPLVLTDGRFAVAALGLQGGALHWLSPLGTTPLRGWLRRVRSDASRVVVDMDSVYVLTNVGAAARLDRSSGRIRWLARLPRSRMDDTRQAGKGPTVEFAPSDPVLADGRLVVAPSDSHHVVCLDAASGEELWKAPVTPETTHLVGVAADRVILGGKKVLCYDLTPNGGVPRLMWQKSLADGGPRGFVRGRHVYVPSGDTVIRFRIHDPTRKGKVIVDTDRVLGNLTPLPNGLVASDVRGVTVFADRAAERDVIARKIAEAPDDVILRLDMARCCFDDEDPAKEEEAIRNLEFVLQRLGEVGSADRELRAEVRELLFTVHLRRTRRGMEGAAARAGELAESKGEKVRLALARAEAFEGQGSFAAAEEVLQTAFPQARGTVLGLSRGTCDAEHLLRARLLGLVGKPGVGAWSEGEARRAKAEGTVVADLFPAATSAPTFLLAEARRELEKDPASAWDLAARLWRDYPSSPEALQAVGVERAALRARGLEIREPAESLPSAVEEAFRSHGTVAATFPRLARLPPEPGEPELVLVLDMPRQDTLRLRCREPGEGPPRWEVTLGAGRPDRSTPNRGTRLPALVAAARFGDRLIVTTDRGAYWLRIAKDGRSARLDSQLVFPAPKRPEQVFRTQQVRIVVQVDRGGARPIAPDVRVLRPTPALVGDRVVVLAPQEITAYRADESRPEAAPTTARRVWTRADLGVPMGAPACWGDRLVETRATPGRVFVRRLDTGDPSLTVELEPAAPAGAAIVGPGGALYVASARGEVSRYDLLTGQWVWSRGLDAAAARLVHADGERVVALREDGMVIALSSRDGEPLWTSRIALRGEGFQDHIVADGLLLAWIGAQPTRLMRQGGGWAVAQLGQSKIRALELATGDEPWDPVTVPTPGGYFVPGALARAGPVILCPVASPQGMVRVSSIRIRDGVRKADAIIRQQTGQWLRAPDLVVFHDRVVLTTAQGVHTFGGDVKEEGAGD
jgi:outer membrane protein assembly factor BamB